MARNLSNAAASLLPYSTIEAAASGNWIMNIPMMCFCDFCVGCKVADRELLSQKHEITSQRVK